MKVGDPTPFAQDVEGQWFFDKEVHVRARKRRAPEGEDGLAFVAYPGRADLGIRELARRYRRTGTKAERLQCPDGRQHVVTIQGNHEIEVCGQPKVTVEDDGDSSDNDVSNPRVGKGLQN